MGVKMTLVVVRHLLGLSQKFCSGEYFVLGPIFSQKIVPIWNQIFRKSGPVLKILFQVRFFISLSIVLLETSSV